MPLDSLYLIHRDEVPTVTRENGLFLRGRAVHIDYEDAEKPMLGIISEPIKYVNEMKDMHSKVAGWMPGSTILDVRLMRSEDQVFFRRILDDNNCVVQVRYLSRT